MGQSASKASQEKWEKLMGRDNWDGLLEPYLDIDLRKFILRCGDTCHAAYDAFTLCGKDSNQGVSLDDIKLPDTSRYRIHASLYATTDLSFVEQVLHIPARLLPPAAGEHVPEWMGFCAATTDEASRAMGRREIWVAWRGTQRLYEWKNNFVIKKVSAKSLLRDFDKKRESKPKIMKGWFSIYTSTESGRSSRVKTSAREQLTAQVRELLEMYKRERVSIVVTGQSLGAVMAILSAFDLAENVVPPSIIVTAVVFGCPKIGNKAFKLRVERRPNLKILHVRNRKDVVPRFPPFKYASVGKELVIDTAKSPVPSLSESKHPGAWHDLEATLHMVAGWNGADEPYDLRVERSTDRLMESTKAFCYFRSAFKLWMSRVKAIFHGKRQLYRDKAI